MKYGRFLFLIVLSTYSICAWAKPPKLSYQVSLANSEILKQANFEKGDDADHWTTTLDICWQGTRAKICSASAQGKRQSFSLRCGESHSANCLGKSCYLSNFKDLKEEASNFAIIKGVHRDFLLFQGAGSGCGGSRYSIYVFDEKSNLRCQWAEGVVASGEPEDEKADKLLQKVNSDPLTFIHWKSNQSCGLRFSKDQKAILKAKQ